VFIVFSQFSLFYGGKFVYSIISISSLSIPPIKPLANNSQKGYIIVADKIEEVLFHISLSALYYATVT
jgi:hypothetical protein